MQLQCRKVRAENDEYEREQQHLAKQIKHVVVLRNDHILAFCAVRNRAHILKTLSMQYVHFALLILFTLRCTCMDQQSQKHVPCLLTNPHVLVQRSLRCTRGVYTLRIRTPCQQNLMVNSVHKLDYYFNGMFHFLTQENSIHAYSSSPEFSLRIHHMHCMQCLH